MRFRLAALLGLVLVGAPTAVLADTQASASSYRCGSKNPYYGRTDAICVDTSQKGLAAVGNGDVVMGLNRYLWVDKFEDFVGKEVNVTDAWLAEKDTSAAGSPTMAIVADADWGQYEMTLANTNEAEVLTLYTNDELNIDSDRDPVVVFRLNVAVLPSAAAEILVFGLASAQNDTEDSVANHAWFRLEADGDLMIESDDATTDDDDNDTAVDITAGTLYEFKVDCTDPTDCDFFYRSTLGGDWTELLSTTAFSVGADVALQPFAQLSKDSGTGVPSVKIDYVHLLSKRD